MHSTSTISFVSFLALASLSAAQDTGALGNATVVTNNPPGVVVRADLPDTAFTPFGNGNIKGAITAASAVNGIGVNFQILLDNLPKEGGPFLYHIHDAPVPDSGNCTATLAHLDPFVRGEATPCVQNLPQTCQVGDLSGKYGKIEAGLGGRFAAQYTDMFASLVPGLGSNFANRSVVIHFANKTRITCANFKVVQGTLPAPVQGPSGCGGSGGSGTLITSSSNSTLTSPSAPSMPSVVTTSGAGMTSTAVSMTVLTLAAMAFML